MRAKNAFLALLKRDPLKRGGVPSRDDVAAVSDLRPRAARVRLKPLHGLSLCLADRPDGLIPVLNISVTGMGIDRRARAEWPGAGLYLRGELLISGERFPVQLTLIHVTGDIVGLAFGRPEDRMVEYILGHLRTEFAAIDMLQVSSSALAPDPDGTPYWFHGENNCEVYFVEKEGKIARFHILFFANYIEGGFRRPVRFGQVVEGEWSERTAPVHWQEFLDAETLAAATRFLSQIAGLDARHREAILSLIY